MKNYSTFAPCLIQKPFKDWIRIKVIGNNISPLKVNKASLPIIKLPADNFDSNSVRPQSKLITNNDQIDAKYDMEIAENIGIHLSSILKRFKLAGIDKLGVLICLKCSSLLVPFFY